MDIQKIRERFKHYRQRIAELNEELESSYFYHEEAISRANQRANQRVEACRRESAERERQAEADRWYREGEIEKATKELEQARVYGDSWGAERALKKLKRLY
jgi:hypothetical protein